MKRGLALLLVVLTTIVAFAQTAQNPFEPEIVAYEKADVTNPPKKGGIVFVGSSSIRLWKTLATDFPEYNVINRGFGGSALSDSVIYADRIVIPYAPRMVVMFAGTNDIASGKSAETVFGDYKAFVAKVKGKLPDAKFAYINITPAPSRKDKWDEMKKLNAMVADYSKTEKNLLFVDMWDTFYNDGKGRPELFVGDQLHLKLEGYAVWVEAMKPVLAMSPEEK